MRFRLFFVLLLSTIFLSGCPLLAMLGGGGDSTKGPTHALKYMQKKVAELDTTYYQDKNGLNPNLRRSYGKTHDLLIKQYNINEEPMRAAELEQVLNVQCKDNPRYSRPEGYTKEWTDDKEGSAKYFAALPGLVSDVLQRHARWAAFTYCQERSHKGNTTGEDAIRANEKIRRGKLQMGGFGLLPDVKKKIGKLADCPNAPPELAGELAAMVDKSFEEVFPLVNTFLDMRLSESLEGNKFAKNGRDIKKGAQNKLIKAIKRGWGEKYNIKTIRFADSWEHRDKWERDGDGLKRIKEDWTHVLLYTDPGPDLPFYKCHVLDGVRDYRQGKKYRARWAYGHWSCDYVPKKQ